MKNNPWEELKNITIKRVNPKLKFNIFWAKSLEGKYCFLIRLDKAVFKKQKLNLKEIKIVYSDEYKNELLFILKDFSNWEIFKILCDDLVQNAFLLKTEEELIKKVYERLREWKNLLKSEQNMRLSFEEQMGLFAELKTIQEILIKKIKLETTLTMWRGPERELQDFLCENSVLEIKSTLTSKGNTATISSVFQLETVKKKLFLVFYSLSTSDKGESITDIVNSIEKMIYDEEIKIEFLKKLFNIGYDINEDEYIKFKIDDIKFYDVRENFPKLNSKDIAPQIKEIKYKIDLSECKEFEINKIILEENL